MDKYKALILAEELKGKQLNGYNIKRFVNNGKSAAVFEAIKNGQSYALKIFDNELIERFGHEIQIKRIEQEIALVNHDIPNLVKIHNGGTTTMVDGQVFYYIIMEYIDGVNLMEYIRDNDYNEVFVKNILEKLHHITERLLSEEQIVHRDIKPENIMVSTEGKIILMDLGVLKLVGAKSFSDEEEKTFVGTLRYAPPEFLLRMEEDTIEGWRAVNIYQIGAVLHDLIMKKELFEDKVPYSNLVIAIKDDFPSITNDSYSFDLLQISRDMLIKDWKTRIQIVNSKRIERILSLSNKTDKLDILVDNILKKNLNRQAKFDIIEVLNRSTQEKKARKKQFEKELDEIILACFKEIAPMGLFSQYTNSQSFTMITGENTYHRIFQLNKDLKCGFSRALFIMASYYIEETSFGGIGLWGIIPSSSSNINITRPNSLFDFLSKEKNRENDDTKFKFKTIFHGMMSFDDTLKNLIKMQFVKLISVAINTMEKEVSYELIKLEKIARKDSTPSVYLNLPTIAINEF